MPASSLRICRFEGPQPIGAQVGFDTRTYYGIMSQVVEVWTTEEWARLADEDRPRDAVRADNGVWVRLRAV